MSHKGKYRVAVAGGAGSWGRRYTRAYAEHPDCAIVVHPGADHGFSHEGDAWDAVATAAGMADLRALLQGLAG